MNLAKRDSVVLTESDGNRFGGLSRNAINFRPVARREDRAFGKGGRFPDRIQRACHPLLRDGESLPHLNRRRAMIQSGEEEMHFNALSRAAFSLPSRIICSIDSSSARRRSASRRSEDEAIVSFARQRASPRMSMYAS